MNSNITFSLLVCVSCLMLAIHGRMFLMDEEDLATLARSRRDAPVPYTPRVVHAPGQTSRGEWGEWSWDIQLGHCYSDGNSHVYKVKSEQEHHRCNSSA